MLRVLGRSTAINVIKVLWCLEELGLEFRREDFGGPFGKIKEQPYLSLNPNGRVPTVIEDDGFVLWEGNSIIRYLTARHDFGGLYPEDLKQRQLADRWLDWFTGIGAPAMLPVFWTVIRLRPENNYAALPEGVDVLPPLEVALARLTHNMRVLDGELAKTPFLGGARLTMADFGVGVVAYRWFNLPIERPELPHLRAWYERLTQRPGYRKHVMIPLA